MKRRSGSIGGGFHWGYAFNLLAAVLLVSAPVLQAVHLSADPHPHGVSHGFTTLPKGHATGALVEKSPVVIVSSLSDHDRTIDHCPICQALGALGQHFTLREPAALDPPAVATMAALPEFYEPLSSLRNYSLSPRAPPSTLT